MKKELRKEANQWLFDNQDKWHMEKDDYVYDVSEEEIPELVKKHISEQKKVMDKIKKGS